MRIILVLVLACGQDILEDLKRENKVLSRQNQSLLAQLRKLKHSPSETIATNRFILHSLLNQYQTEIDLSVKILLLEEIEQSLCAIQIFMSPPNADLDATLV